MQKLVILGLDCATPELLFGSLRSRMPNLSALMDRGAYGPLTSTIPPITVPAWSAMVTSRDPGQLGFYGFRNRVDHSYDNLAIADGRAVKAKTLWQLLGRARRRSLVMGVPQTYPPAPMAGALVAGFLTPEGSTDYTWPPEFRERLLAAAGGEYVIDVRDFRTDAKRELLAQIIRMTEIRFRAFRELFAADDYDFGMLVEMGTDRLHHGFWRYFDTNHRLHEPGNPFAQAIPDYYALIDRELGLLVESLPPETSVMVVSDHGAKGMHGAICLNGWLIQQGYLALKEPVDSPRPLDTSMIDWSRTRAWGAGGYYGRVFVNLEGREPQGRVPAGEYETFCRRLVAELTAIPDDRGRPLATVVHRPSEIYQEVKGVPPDLIVYFGDLDWRSAGTVGCDTIHLFENDTGPDDANHAQEGIFVWDQPVAEPGGPFSIYDVAPTVLEWFGLPPRRGMIGRSLAR